MYSVRADVWLILCRLIMADGFPGQANVCLPLGPDVIRGLIRSAAHPLRRNLQVGAVPAHP